MDQFDHMVAFVEHRAPRLLERDGHHAHLLMVCRDGHISVGGLAFGNDQEKEAIRQVLTRQHAGQAEWYVEVMEAWVLKAMAVDDALGQLRPSLNPRRQEALVLTAGHRDGRSRLVRWEIRRSGDSVSVGEPEIGGAGSGWLDEPLLGVKREGGLRCDGEGRLTLWGGRDDESS